LALTASSLFCRTLFHHLRPEEKESSRRGKSLVYFKKYLRDPSPARLLRALRHFNYIVMKKIIIPNANDRPRLSLLFGERKKEKKKKKKKREKKDKKEKKKKEK